MPTLLQINTVINSGSTGKIAEEIGETALANGWKSYIAYGRNDKESKSIKIKIGDKFDIYYHVLKTRMFDRHGFGSKRATKKLVSEIKQIKPDIIHLHNLHGYYLNISVLFKYLHKTDIPVIWTLHDCWSFTGHCAYFDYVKCGKWKIHCEKCPQKKSYPTSDILDSSRKNYTDKKYLFNLTDNINFIAVSKWLKNLAAQSFIQKYSVKQIYNGINLDIFHPDYDINAIKKKWGIENEFIILGVASVWDKRKGLEDFIKLSKLIRYEYKIVLVGLSEKQIKGLPPTILGISKTENMTELAELYATADLYANLTYEDNFPTTNIEALACGTPVLTYNTGGSIEAVSPETGFIVNQGDLNGVVNVIENLKSTGKKDYIRPCRQRAVDLFDKNNRYKDYIKLYNDILGN